MKFLSKAKSYFYAQRARRNARAESGRSMVEMLGVLAIIGVITVGAMIGYRYAMERIMTNSIITGVRARAVVIGQQRVLGHPLNLSEFHPDTEKDLIYGHFEVRVFEDYYEDGSGYQALEVRNIPKRVCEKIQDTEFPDDHITLVNGDEVGDTPLSCIPDGPTENTGNIHDAGDYFTAEYHNTVTFVFMDLEDVECDRNEQCAPCHSCIDGFCTADENGARCGGPSGGCCMGGRCLLPGSKECRCIASYDDPTSKAYACCLEGYTEETQAWTCCLNPDDPVCQEPADRCAANTCGDCMRCDSDSGTCVLDATQNGQTCGSNGCSVCENGSCLNKMTQIKKCDGTQENCCPLTTTCTNETNCLIDCTETPGICQKCDTTTGKLVPDKEGESCGTCGTCTNGECQDSSIGNYYDPSETPSTQKCCAANSVPIKGWGDVKYPGSDNQWSIETTFCCPAGTKSWAANESKLNRCCAGDAVTKTGTSRSFCCPTGSKYVAKNNDCCSYDPLGTGSYLDPSDGSDVCCPENSVIEQVASSSYTTKDYCCPAGTTVWAKNEEGAARCCAQKNVRGYCCPEGTEYAIQGTCCDSNTMGVLYDPAQNPSPEMCCPTGSVKINARGTGTSHNSSETGLIDFCCPAGTTRWAQNEEGAARCCNGTVLNGKCYEPGEDLCADITCGVCEVCQEGKCVSNGDACCGVTCGACEECQGGRCISRCQSTEKCVDNVCVPKGKCDDLIGEELTCCQNDKVWCNGTCLETGCCASALPQSGESYYDCYECNQTTNRYRRKTGFAWCPVSRKCRKTCCNYRSWGIRGNQNCDGIDAIDTCVDAPSDQANYYFACKGEGTHTIEKSYNHEYSTVSDGSELPPLPPPGKEAKYYETTGG